MSLDDIDIDSWGNEPEKEEIKPKPKSKPEKIKEPKPEKVKEPKPEKVKEPKVNLSQILQRLDFLDQYKNENVQKILELESKNEELLNRIQELEIIPQLSVFDIEDPRETSELLSIMTRFLNRIKSLNSSRIQRAIEQNKPIPSVHNDILMFERILNQWKENFNSI